MEKVIYVSSTNPAKLEAVMKAANKLFPKAESIQVNALEVDSRS